MKRRAKLSLRLMPILVLTPAFSWADGKAQHPPLTKFTQAVRARLVADKQAYLRFRISSKEFYVPLSLSERREIASHLYVDASQANTFIPSESLSLHFKSGNLSGTPKIQETVEIKKNSNDDFLGVTEVTSTSFNRETRTLTTDTSIKAYHIDLTTSRYLRQWLATHPDVRKQLHLP